MDQRVQLGQQLEGKDLILTREDRIVDEDHGDHYRQ